MITAIKTTKQQPVGIKFDNNLVVCGIASNSIFKGSGLHIGHTLQSINAIPANHSQHNNTTNATNANNNRVITITKVLCNYENDKCNNFALDNGVCGKHGGMNFCRHIDKNGNRDCTNFIQQGGKCIRHGAKRSKKRKLCTHSDNVNGHCKNIAVQGGKCTRHGANRKLCTHSDNGKGCGKHAVQGGKCSRHGANRKLCTHSDNGQRCGNTAKKGGYCITHGGGTKCKHVDNGQRCDKIVQKGGYCRIHGRFRGITRGVTRGIIEARGIIGGDVNEKFLSQTNGEDSHQQEPPTKRTRVINTFSGGAGPSTAAVATPNATTPGSTTAGAAGSTTRSHGTSNDTGAASGMPTLPHSQLRGRQQGVQRGTVRPPALTDNTIDWAEVNQAELPDNGYSLIEFNFDGKEMMSDGTTGVIMLKGSNDIDCIVGAIKMTSPADIHTELKAGDILAPVGIDGEQSFRSTLDYYKDTVKNRRPKTLYAWRKSFMCDTGSILQRSEYHTDLLRLIKESSEELREPLYSSQDLETYQGRDGSSNTCAVISVLISIAHGITVVDEAEEDDENPDTELDAEESATVSVSNDGIKDIIDNRAPALATQIRERRAENTLNIEAYEVWAPLVRTHFTVFDSPETFGGNILREEYINKLKDVLMQGRGNIGISFYFNRHYTCILRSEYTDNNVTRFRYDFIDPLPDSSINGPLRNARRETFTVLSCLMTRIVQYHLAKLSTYPNLDELVTRRWSDRMLKRSSNHDEQDVRIFTVTIFKHSKYKESLPTLRPPPPPPPVPPPPLLASSNDGVPPRDLYDALDDIFHNDPDADNYHDLVKSHLSLARLSESTKSQINARLVILRQQPGVNDIRDMVDCAFVAADNNDEHISAIVKAVRSEWVVRRNLHNIDFKLAKFTINIVKERVDAWKQPESRSVKRYVKQITQDDSQDDPQEVETLVIDRYFVNVNECAADTGIGLDELATNLTTARDRVGGYADSANNHYYELLNDNQKIRTKQKLARMTSTTVQGENDEVTEVTLEKQIVKMVVDNNGDIVQGQERTFTNVQHCLVQEEDLLGYLNVDGMTKSMKKKGYFEHEEVEGEEVTRTHYYRFVHPWYRANNTRTGIKTPFSKERIIDKHNRREHSIVLKQPYDPNLQVLTDPEATFRTGEEFWNAITACGTTKQRQGLIVELKTARGYPLYAHHKYPTRSSIVVPTKRQIIRRILIHKLQGKSNRTERMRHFNEDRRETKRIYNESGARFENVIKNEKSFWHATNVKLENMERTDAQKEANEYWLQPSHMLNQQLLPRRSLGHKDVFCTRRALQSMNIIRKRVEIKNQPGYEMLLFELDIDASSMTASGLTKEGKWKTPGQQGVYKLGAAARIKRIIRVKFGGIGNLSDPDTRITEIHRKCNKTVSINMKRGVKTNTALYKNGMFNLYHPDQVRDDESIGEEKYVLGIQPPSLDDLEDDPDIPGIVGV